MEVIAHRGASRLELENTFAAFRRAVEVGAHGIELDVRRSLDGRLVVHHDAALGDGRAIIETEASALPPHVLTLGDALDACSGAWVNVEIKNDRRDPDFDPTLRLADDVVHLLRDTDTDDRWLVSSFDHRMIGRVAELAPGIATAWLVREVPDDVLARLDGHIALHPRVDLLERRHVELLHGAGYRVNTWTCNDVDRMLELADWGVDGVCTDVPDVALSALAERRSGQESTTGNTNCTPSGT